MTKTFSPRKDRPWWRDAVTYQIYIRSFADSNGDGKGDVEGIRSRLPYLKKLGIDAIWITPWYPSPQHDHGYDVADYMNIEPDYGTLAQAEQLIKETHDLGIKFIVDIVPNHSSNQHRWFQEALNSATQQAQASTPHRRCTRSLPREPRPSPGPRSYLRSRRTPSIRLAILQLHPRPPRQPARSKFPQPPRS